MLEQFKREIAAIFDLNYEYEEYKSSISAVSRGNLSVAWSYDVGNNWEFEMLDIENGQRVLYKGSGSSAKQAFNNRKKVGK